MASGSNMSSGGAALSRRLNLNPRISRTPITSPGGRVTGRFERRYGWRPIGPAGRPQSGKLRKHRTRRALHGGVDGAERGAPSLGEAARLHLGEPVPAIAIAAVAAHLREHALSAWKAEQIRCPFAADPRRRRNQHLLAEKVDRLLEQRNKMLVHARHQDS